MFELDVYNASYTYRDLETWFALLTFLFCWALFAKNWPQLPVGRTAAALLGGSLMVTLKVITAVEAFSSISGGTMLLLIGLMIILAKMEEKGITGPLRKLLLIGNPSPRIFLVRVSLCSAFLGATIMNDGAAIFLTSVVMDIADEYGLLLEPYALAVATSANIGSAATVLGNPKNMLVVEKVPGLDFLTFSRKMGPPSVICTLINTVFLVLYYWDDLDSLPLLPEKVDKNLQDEELDDDVARMEQEYLASKSNLQDEEYPPLAYLINEDTPLTNNSNNNNGAFCDQITETPRRYETSTFDSYKSTSHFFKVNEDTISDHQSIMSPALSFFDLDELELNNIPKYKWPTQASINNNQHNMDTIQSYFSYPNSTIHPKDILPFTLNQIQANRNNSLQSSKQMLLIDFIKYNYKDILIGFTLIFMYTGFILKWNLGFTCLTSAMIILFIDNKDASSIINEHINWSLLSYLFGVFSLLCGVSKTPLPGDLFQKFAPLINPKVPNLKVSTIAFSGLVILLSFVFTSIPTVLLISPYIPLLNDPIFKRNAWYLLAWSVTLCGNLTAFGSVAGLIVSEICKDYCIEDKDNSKIRRKRPNQWIGELIVWSKFTLWSTIILLIIGAFYIVYEI
ncbi:hypothetical protein K502DRAFT_341907 [Neoconidiobolus thromboides FSU 785]|nr:hypothetical protein K502DRAFT_341907 [Neoconidiobolus thromboides FSU 785]